jgi:hypothetical protein
MNVKGKLVKMMRAAAVAGQEAAADGRFRRSARDAGTASLPPPPLIAGAGRFILVEVVAMSLDAPERVSR